MKKKYCVWVTSYHRFDVEADNPQDAEEKAHEVIWDDYIRDFVIDVEEQDQ